jgi:hypothetical protein
MPYAVKFYASFFSLFLAGCSAATPPPRDDLAERYKQFTARFIARLDEAGITSECINKHRKMLGAAALTGDTETQRLASEGLKNRFGILFIDPNAKDDVLAELNCNI